MRKPGAKYTLKELERLKEEGKIRGYSISPENRGIKEEKKSKYGNQKTQIDGILFDSAREGKRYIELRYLLKAGEIKELERQKEYELNEGGSHSVKYICDFRYILSKTNEVIVEDVKGFATREFKKKRKLMLKVWGIKIKEI